MAHPFSGLNGGPRFLSFIPSSPDIQSSIRLLVASGQSGGGMQIIVPFEPSQNDNPDNFLLPQLDRGESISAMVVAEDKLALGASQSRVLSYKMAYSPHQQPRATGSPPAGGLSAKEFVPSAARFPGSTNGRSDAPPRPMQSLQIPPFVAPLPELSLDASILQSDNPNVRNGINDRIKSVFTAYALVGVPKISHITPGANSSFGPLAENVLLTPSRKEISPQLTEKAGAFEGDFLMTIPTTSLELDILADHSTVAEKKPRKYALPNPNKTIYCKKLLALCYQQDLNRNHQIPGDRSSRNNYGAVRRCSCDFLVCTFS